MRKIVDLVKGHKYEGQFRELEQRFSKMAAEIESAKGIGAENATDTDINMQQKTAAEDTAGGDDVDEISGDVECCIRIDGPTDFNPDGLSLKEQLEDALYTSESYEQRYVYIGNFSHNFADNVKKFINIKNLPIVMNYRDAYLSMQNKQNGKYQGQGVNYHNLGVEGLESALLSFNNPEYVILSPTKGRIELILEGRDYKNHQLFSIVEINTNTQHGGKYLDAHVVTSVYGNRGLKNRINIAEADGRVIYKKAEELSQGMPQVQYERNFNDNSSTDILLDNSENVNMNFETDADEQYHIDIDEVADIKNKEGMPFGEKKLKYNKDKTFSEQITEVLENKFPSGTQIYIRETPKKLRDIGFDGNLPLITTQREIRVARYPRSQGKYHRELTKEQIASLPGKISNPVMILDSLNSSDNSVVIVTDVINKDGLPVVVTVKAGDDGTRNSVKIKANYFNSYRGKDKLSAFINANLEADSFLYINSKKIQELQEATGTELVEMFIL